MGCYIHHLVPPSVHELACPVFSFVLCSCSPPLLRVCVCVYIYWICLPKKDKKCRHTFQISALLLFWNPISSFLFSFGLFLFHYFSLYFPFSSFNLLAACDSHVCLGLSFLFSLLLGLHMNVLVSIMLLNYASKAQNTCGDVDLFNMISTCKSIIFIQHGVV